MSLTFCLPSTWNNATGTTKNDNNNYVKKNNKGVKNKNTYKGRKASERGREEDGEGEVTERCEEPGTSAGSAPKVRRC